MAAVKDISNFSLRKSRETLMGKKLHISDKEQFSYTLSSNYDSVSESDLVKKESFSYTLSSNYDSVPESDLIKKESFLELIPEITTKGSFLDTGQKMPLHRSWNLYSTSTQGTQQWYTHKINYTLINTVGNFWGYINMFFPLGNNNPVLPLDLENNNRKEISFFQEGIFPNWYIIKKTNQCLSLN